MPVFFGKDPEIKHSPINYTIFLPKCQVVLQILMEFKSNKNYFPA